MKVLYYTRPYFFDAALSFVRSMSRRVELHLVLEVSPDSKQSSIMNIRGAQMKNGIYPAEPVLNRFFPNKAREYWANTASFKLAVDNSPKSTSFSSVKTSFRTAEYINSQKPDILHMDDVSLRFAWGVFKLKPPHKIMNIHDPFPHPGENNWRTMLARKLSFYKMDAFFLHNRSQKSDFQHKYKLKREKTAFIRLGTYDIFKSWSFGHEKTESRTVLFFGRISKYKGLEVFYRALIKAAEEVSGLRAIIAGRTVPGYTLPAPPELANNGKIEMRTGHVSNYDLVRLIQTSTLVVCPYISATQSGVILTAGAFEKPVIATKVGGIPDYIEHNKNGLLVPPNDSEALARAMTDLINRPGFKQKILSNIKKTNHNRLSWDSITRQAHNFYHSLAMK